MFTQERIFAKKKSICIILNLTVPQAQTKKLRDI